MGQPLLLSDMGTFALAAVSLSVISSWARAEEFFQWRLLALAVMPLFPIAGVIQPLGPRRRRV